MNLEELLLCPYSKFMVAKKVYEMNNIKNVTNGFHAFPDKIRAFEEITQVLKNDGDFTPVSILKIKKMHRFIYK